VIVCDGARLANAGASAMKKATRKSLLVGNAQQSAQLGKRAVVQLSTTLLSRRR
jgi:hypothetical protein